MVWQLPLVSWRIEAWGRRAVQANAVDRQACVEIEGSGRHVDANASRRGVAQGALDRGRVVCRPIADGVVRRGRDVQVPRQRPGWNTVGARRSAGVIRRCAAGIHAARRRGVGLDVPGVACTAPPIAGAVLLGQGLVDIHELGDARAVARRLPIHVDLEVGGRSRESPGVARRVDDRLAAGWVMISVAVEALGLAARVGTAATGAARATPRPTRAATRCARAAAAAVGPGGRRAPCEPLLVLPVLALELAHKLELANSLHRSMCRRPRAVERPTQAEGDRPILMAFISAHQQTKVWGWRSREPGTRARFTSGAGMFHWGEEYPAAPGGKSAGLRTGSVSWL